MPKTGYKLQIVLLREQRWFLKRGITTLVLCSQPHPLLRRVVKGGAGYVRLLLVYMCLSSFQSIECGSITIQSEVKVYTS